MTSRATIVLVCASLFVALSLVPPETNRFWFPRGVYQIANYSRPTDPPLRDWSDARLARRDGESDLDFAARMTRVVHGATYHCDHTDYRGSLTRMIAGWGGWINRSYGVLALNGFDCGLCHQRAFLLARALRGGGLTADVAGLDGHVITVFAVDGVQYAADADYGVEPFRMKGADIRAVYGRALSPFRPELMPVIEKAFEREQPAAYDYTYLLHESERQAEIFTRLTWGTE